MQPLSQLNDVPRIPQQAAEHVAPLKGSFRAAETGYVSPVIMTRSSTSGCTSFMGWLSGGESVYSSNNFFINVASMTEATNRKRLINMRVLFILTTLYFYLIFIFKEYMLTN